VSVLTLDPDTSGPQTIPFSLNASYGANAPMPCEVMPTIFQGGWGDWSPAAAGRIESTALACWMRGVTFIAGDRLHPEGRLTAISREALKVVAGIRETWDTCAPAANADLRPDIAVLHSPSLTEGPDRRFFAVGDPRERLTPINGMHRLLLDGGFSFTVAAEWQLARILDRVSMVVVPEIPQIEEITEQQLLAFAARGGVLLFTGTLPLVEGRPFQETGVRVGTELWQDHAYLPAWENGESGVLVRGPIRPVTLAGAERMLALTAAYDARPGQRYGWGIGPEAETPSDQPAMVCRDHGAGKIGFLNVPIASDYAKSGNWAQSKWLGRLILSLRGETGASLSAGEGNVELIVWSNANSSWLFLLEHEAEQLVGEGRLWARRTRDPAPRSCTVRMKKEKPRARLHLLRATRGAIFEDDLLLEITCEFAGPFAALRLDWED
jgi:hypothetical protein